MEFFVFFSLLFFLSNSIYNLVSEFSVKNIIKTIFNIFSVLGFSIFLFSYLMDEKKADDYNVNKFDAFYMENKSNLEREIFLTKCKNVPENIKKDFGFCDMKNMKLSYSLIASTKVILYVSDGVLYKDPYLINKLRKLLIEYFYNEKDMDIKEHLKLNYREGPTYFNILKNSMGLCEKYSFYNFGDLPNEGCGIIYKVVPANELPAGKVYVVKSYSEGDK